MRKQFKLNNKLLNNPAGTVLSLDADKNGKPVDKFWSDRFEDAKIDNCIELVKASKVEENNKNKENIKK